MFKVVAPPSVPFHMVPDRAALNARAIGQDWSAMAVGGLDAFFARLEETPVDAPVRLRAEHAGGGRPIIVSDKTPCARVRA